MFCGLVVEARDDADADEFVVVVDSENRPAGVAVVDARGVHDAAVGGEAFARDFHLVRDGLDDAVVAVEHAQVLRKAESDELLHRQQVLAQLLVDVDFAVFGCFDVCPIGGVHGGVPIVSDGPDETPIDGVAVFVVAKLLHTVEAAVDGEVVACELESVAGGGHGVEVCLDFELVAVRDKACGEGEFVVVRRVGVEPAFDAVPRGDEASVGEQEACARPAVARDFFLFAVVGQGYFVGPQVVDALLNMLLLNELRDAEAALSVALLHLFDLLPVLLAVFGDAAGVVEAVLQASLLHLLHLVVELLGRRGECAMHLRELVALQVYDYCAGDYAQGDDGGERGDDIFVGSHGLLPEQVEARRHADAADEAFVALRHDERQFRAVGGELYLVARLQVPFFVDAHAVEIGGVGLRQLHEFPVVAFADYGCVPTADGCERLVETDLAFGVAAYLYLVDDDFLRLAGFVVFGGYAVLEDVVSTTVPAHHRLHA